MAVGVSGGSVQLLDADTGKLKREFVGHTQYIRSLAYSPDGTMLATSTYDDTLGLWDTETGTVRLLLIETSGYLYRVSSATFSRDGKLVACLVYNNATNHINTYQTASGELLHSIRVYTHPGPGAGGIQRTPEIEHSRWVNKIAFSPDGTTIASCATDNAIRFWDVDNGTHLRKLYTDEYNTRDIAFSPDGQTIIG